MSSVIGIRQSMLFIFAPEKLLAFINFRDFFQKIQFKKLTINIITFSLRNQKNGIIDVNGETVSFILKFLEY